QQRQLVPRPWVPRAGSSGSAAPLCLMRPLGRAIVPQRCCCAGAITRILCSHSQRSGVHAAMTEIGARASMDIDALRAQTPGCAGRIHLNNAGAALLAQPTLDAMTAQLRLEAEIGGGEGAGGGGGRG